MKTTILSIMAVLGMVMMGSCSTQKSTMEDTITRDSAYEAYCDSIWDNDPDYYLDVLCTTDEYQDYVEANGRWWED